MDLVKIDGVVYDVHVTAIEETAKKEYGKNNGTAIYRNRSILDIAGIKYAHKITFSPSYEAPEMLDELFSYLFDNVRESVMIEVVHGQKTISYDAEYSTGVRRVAYISKKKDAEESDFVGWDDLTVEFVSRETIVNAAGV